MTTQQQWVGPTLDSGLRGNQDHQFRHGSLDNDLDRQDEGTCTFDDTLNAWRQADGLICPSCNVSDAVKAGVQRRHHLARWAQVRAAAGETGPHGSMSA